jgi:hypothetical protein
MAKAARRNTKTRLGVTKSAAEAEPAREALPVIPIVTGGNNER